MLSEVPFNCFVVAVVVGLFVFLRGTGIIRARCTKKLINICYIFRDLPNEIPFKLSYSLFTKQLQQGVYDSRRRLKFWQHKTVCFVVCLCVLYVFFKVYLALFWIDREQNFLTRRYLPCQFFFFSLFPTPTLSKLNHSPEASIKACKDSSNRHCGFRKTRKSGVLLQQTKVPHSSYFTKCNLG